MDKHEQLVDKIRSVIEEYLDDLDDLTNIDTDCLADSIAAAIDLHA